MKERIQGKHGVPSGTETKLVRPVESEEVGNLLGNGTHIGVLDGYRESEYTCSEKSN